MRHRKWRSASAPLNESCGYWEHRLRFRIVLTNWPAVMVCTFTYPEYSLLSLESVSLAVACSRRGPTSTTDGRASQAFSAFADDPNGVGNPVVSDGNECACRINGLPWPHLCQILVARPRRQFDHARTRDISQKHFRASALVPGRRDCIWCV